MSEHAYRSVGLPFPAAQNVTVRRSGGATASSEMTLSQVNRLVEARLRRGPIPAPTDSQEPRVRVPRRFIP